MALTSTDIKAWLQISGTQDDAVISALLIATKAFLETEICSAYEDLSASSRVAFDVAQRLLCGHWYENREATRETSIDEVPIGLQRIIDHLKNWGAYETSIS